MQPHETPDPFYRLGAAILAAIAGLLVGLVVALLTVAVGYENTNLGTSLIGGTVAGFLSGLFLPAAVMDFVGGVTSFFLGAVTAAASLRTDKALEPEDFKTSGGYQIIFVFGFFFVLALYALDWTN